MDAATSDIRAVEFTPGSDGDSPVLPELLNKIPEGEEIGTVTAPLGEWMHSPVGQGMARMTRPKPDRGGNAVPQGLRERVASRDPGRQTGEIQIRIALINRFNAPGTDEIVREA